MYTSIVCVALSGLVSSATAGGPSWTSDYGAALKRAAREKKPVAVFIASGKEGWNKLCDDGSLSRKAERLLADKYVCVYVNTGTQGGRELAQDFEIPDGLGIVISDGTGEVQAFRHEGDLTSSTLTRYLERYSDANRAVEATETNPGKAGQVVPLYQPVYQSFPVFQGGFAPSFGGCAGGSCGR